jgi:hypothetical protein
MNENSSVIVVTRKLDKFWKTDGSMAGRGTQRTSTKKSLEFNLMSMEKRVVEGRIQQISTDVILYGLNTYVCF